MASSLHVMDLKRDTFGLPINLPSLSHVVLALCCIITIFSAHRVTECGLQKPPSSVVPEDQKKPGLNSGKLNGLFF